MAQLAGQLGSWMNEWLGKKVGDKLKQYIGKVFKTGGPNSERDLLVFLQSQLIKGVPFALLPYPHGFIHQPTGYDNDRYSVMKDLFWMKRITTIQDICSKIQSNGRRPVRLAVETQSFLIT